VSAKRKQKLAKERKAHQFRVREEADKLLHIRESQAGIDEALGLVRDGERAVVVLDYLVKKRTHRIWRSVVLVIVVFWSAILSWFARWLGD
jgi:hypothetical protein